MPLKRSFPFHFIGYMLAISLWACDHQPPAVVVPPVPNTALVAVQNTKEPFDRHAHLIYTHHARCRMNCRHITSVEIHEILDSGTINYAKSEPNAHPDPKYAVEGSTHEGQHLRVVFAPSRKDLIVITCIELGVEWHCHCN